MSFTRVSCSVKKERKNNAWISNSQQQKNSKNNEEGYKIQTTKYLFLRRKDVKV
jgi:hypothetical protein